MLLTSLLLTPRPPPLSPLFPYTTLFRSHVDVRRRIRGRGTGVATGHPARRRGGFPQPAAHGAVLGSAGRARARERRDPARDRKSTRLNSSHRCISYAVFCLKKKTKLEAR